LEKNVHDLFEVTKVLNQFEIHVDFQIRTLCDFVDVIFSMAFSHGISLTFLSFQGNPIATSKYGGVFKNDSCSGDKTGQKSAISTFEVTWYDLKKPKNVTVEAAVKDVEGMVLLIPIHSEYFWFTKWAFILLNPSS
jgi:hypothetical protein